MAPLAIRWLALLPVLLLLQVGGLMPAPPPTRGPLRGSAIQLGLVFPDSQEGTPADPRSWRKGTVGDSSTTYWWRKGVHESDAPEVSNTPPAEDWKVGKLENGREFLWREGNDPDDPGDCAAGIGGRGHVRPGYVARRLANRRASEWQEVPMARQR